MVPSGPEERARRGIDEALARAGWQVQDRAELNIHAARGVAVREFPLAPGYGQVDYLLFVDGRAVGAIEAKAQGHTLSGVEFQIESYGEGLPPELSAPIRPLPFLYRSTGIETAFVNQLDPRPRSRLVFAVHQPETLAEWLAADPLDVWKASRTGTAAGAVRDEAAAGGGYAARPSTLRARLQDLPPVPEGSLWPNQVEAIGRMERSLAEDRPRALVQMATGTGKTFFAVTALYRLIKLAGARRVLFLVDRTNLGEQAEKEFQSYRTPDDNRKFTELYNVQRLTSDTIAESSTVVISTIQRLYSILKGEPLPVEEEEESRFEHEEEARGEPLPVAYNSRIPPEFFDVIVIDECHRSIYSLWRQVLEYFDAYLIGLTATPAQHTYGFFRGNVVMEYPHERAVADGVNVDFEVYKIRTRITEQGSTIDPDLVPMVGIRDRRTRQLRWQRPDEAISYTAQDLDRKVVAEDQIRLLVRTFKEKLPEIFPDRDEVPKTLIFAKDDSHAEDITKVVREEFGQGNEFCRKITYKVTGAKPADLIQEFRNAYYPRIAVTVDMIATGTDIRPVEIVMFMRSVQSRVLFEQMKGRGVRIISPTELKAVSPSARSKTHFVIVDCVGITDSDLADTQPLEKKKGVSFKKLLDHVAAGGTDPDMLSSLASRLSRLDRQCGAEERRLIADAGGGADLEAMAAGIVDALEPDRQEEEARRRFDLPAGAQPTPDQVKQAGEGLLREAGRPLATSPPLRTLLQDLKKRFEQIIDEASRDELMEAGFSEAAREKARMLTRSFEEFLREHRDEIEALQFFYSQPHGRRLRFKDIKALAAAIKAPPRAWTPEVLWRAYQILDEDSVRGASAQRLLTDIVSLVRYALRHEDELAPFAEQVEERFTAWMAQQEQQGRYFTDEQRRWLEMMRDHVETSLEIEIDDFDEVPFSQEGGLARARQVFGDDLGPILEELNEALAA